MSAVKSVDVRDVHLLNRLVHRCQERDVVAVGHQGGDEIAGHRGLPHELDEIVADAHRLVVGSV